MHKARIDAIAGTSESGSTAVTETDVSVKSEIETDQSPTQSATSNTPLKSALSRRARKNKQKGERWAASKQEYEALARFIVDNVAEGDVPTTAHFKQFSLDVSILTLFPPQIPSAHTHSTLRGIVQAGKLSGTVTSSVRLCCPSSSNIAGRSTRRVQAIDHGLKRTPKKMSRPWRNSSSNLFLRIVRRRRQTG